MNKPAAFLSGAVVAVLLLLGSAALYLRQAAHGFGVRAQPTRMETVLARTALHAAMPADLRDRANPVAASGESLHAGMAHFADHCAVCHANNGSGETMLGGSMYPRPPDMRLPATQRKPDGELFSIIENGIRMSGMPAFGGNGASEDESWKLVVFLRHLPALTPAEEQEMQHLNPQSPAEMKEQKQEDDFLNGGPQQP